MYMLSSSKREKLLSLKEIDVNHKFIMFNILMKKYDDVDDEGHDDFDVKHESI